MTPPLAAARVRARCRDGSLTGPTTGLAPEAAQANLVVLPAGAADDFEAYCRANPAPCPLLERLDPGDPEPRITAAGADLRTDLPRYRVHRAGRPPEERLDLRDAYPADAVAFLLGCSFSFEAALSAAGLPPAHLALGRNVPMYRTDRPTVAAGAFGGPLVVSMRPVPPDRVAAAIAITRPFTRAHGAPVHAGDPGALGIADLARPEFGDPPELEAGLVPVFWACGVTSQLAVSRAIELGAVAWAITHAPGHMFLTDLPAQPDS